MGIGWESGIEEVVVGALVDVLWIGLVAIVGGLIVLATMSCLDTGAPDSPRRNGLRMATTEFRRVVRGGRDPLADPSPFGRHRH
jgi:hypothetical protein